MSIAIAIFGLALLIVLHEGGHFLVARLCGMKVERFSIGFGSPLFSFKRGDTIYQIAPVPLGGFVQITGLNPHEEFDHNDPYVYPNRPRWMRLAVLVAGPGANYLTAVVFALVVFLGFGKMTGSTNVVEEVLPNSPAQAAGLKSGDVLMTVNGKELNAGYPIRTAVLAAKGAPVTIALRRAGKVETVTVTPKLNPERGEYLIGIQPGALRQPVPIGEALKEAALVPVVTSGEILKGIYEMITGRQKASLQGPVGIARHMAQAADRGFLDFIHLMTMLSVYLGLFNLLPLPALDGGRALFLGIGALRSKEVNAKTEAFVHMVGLVVLLGVFVIVTFKDIKEIVVRLVN